MSSSSLSSVSLAWLKLWLSKSKPAECSGASFDLLGVVGKRGSSSSCDDWRLSIDRMKWVVWLDCLLFWRLRAIAWARSVADNMLSAVSSSFSLVGDVLGLVGSW